MHKQLRSTYSAKTAPIWWICQWLRVQTLEGINSVVKYFVLSFCPFWQFISHAWSIWAIVHPIRRPAPLSCPAMGHFHQSQLIPATSLFRTPRPGAGEAIILGTFHIDILRWGQKLWVPTSILGAGLWTTTALGMMTQYISILAPSPNECKARHVNILGLIIVLRLGVMSNFDTYWLLNCKMWGSKAIFVCTVHCL